MEISEIYNIWHASYLKMMLAGGEAAIRHTLLNDYLLVAERLEQLGFSYLHGKVDIVNLWDG